MDAFDDIQVEDTAGYAAYQAELEYQEWLESDEAIEEANKELQLLSSLEIEQKAVDLFV